MLPFVLYNADRGIMYGEEIVRIVEPIGQLAICMRKRNAPHSKIVFEIFQILVYPSFDKICTIMRYM